MSAPVEETVVVENGATVDVPTSEVPVAETSGDAFMAEDPETDRKARARRQGTSDLSFIYTLANRYQVEFYFADSNLPYDKYASISTSFAGKLIEIYPQIHVAITLENTRTLGSDRSCCFVQKNAPIFTRGERSEMGF